MRLIKTKRAILLMISISLICACSSVRVTDSNGKPIHNADVWAVSLSMNAGPKLTDENGRSRIPFNIQGAKWVSVGKKGYESKSLDYPWDGERVVVLDEKIDNK